MRPIDEAKEYVKGRLIHELSVNVADAFRGDFDEPKSELMESRVNEWIMIARGIETTRVVTDGNPAHNDGGELDGGGDGR